MPAAGDEFGYISRTTHSLLRFPTSAPLQAHDCVTALHTAERTPLSAAFILKAYMFVRQFFVLLDALRRFIRRKL
jgi:hypothetical protein